MQQNVAILSQYPPSATSHRATFQTPTIFPRKACRNSGKRSAARVPMHQVGELERVRTGPVLASNYMTGTTVYVDCGLTIS